MSDDNFYYNPRDRDPWESAGDARNRQRDIQEKQIAGEKYYQQKISGNENASGWIGRDYRRTRPANPSSMPWIARFFLRLMGFALLLLGLFFTISTAGGFFFGDQTLTELLPNIALTVIVLGLSFLIFRLALR